MKRAPLLLLMALMLQFNALSQLNEMELDKNWKAIRASDITFDGTELTSEKFSPTGWMDAVVPGTIITTLLHNNKVPDPFFGMNNTLIPDIFETGRDHYTYWFYTEFELPGLNEGEQAWLNFRGINYFADIFLNGRRVNTRTHSGMYLREKFLVTPYLNKGKTNRLAVWVAPPDPPGKAYAGQGGDGTIGRNVTMQCTAGWDWICPMHDRNTGIWDKVWLEVTGAADLKDPYITSRVPGIRVPGEKQSPAFVAVRVDVRNATSEPVNATVRIELDGYRSQANVSLGPSETRNVTLPEIRVDNPKLWWPNGTGDQALYKMKLALTMKDGKVSDSDEISFGIREASNYFDQKIRSRVFMVNGQKIFIKGGNWISSDAMLRLTPQRYDAEIRMHAGMNMNMIRVWGGGLTERPEFYDACDKYGILVWQDLWISGDCNGEWLDPMKKETQARRKAYPDNHDLFLESAVDQVKMLRNHPSLYLWCGGNETLPPPDILKALNEQVFPAFDPGRFFLEMSTSSQLMTNTIGGVGDGPYGIREPAEIFTTRSFPFNPETGSIGIPNYDGLKKIIPEDEMTPPENFRGNRSWEYHKYLPLMNFPDRYGKVKDIRDFCFKAQMVSYEQYRALQEAYNYKMWDWYAGMLVWKNQNPWTALRGFFYDYYLDYTGGYFGYMHGAAPLHIQLNLNDTSVCILNQTFNPANSLSAGIMLYDLHGRLISTREHKGSLAVNEVRQLGKVELPRDDDGIFFLKLMLRNDRDQVIDENFYWLSGKPKSYEKLNELESAPVETNITRGDKYHYTVSVSNPGKEPAFFIRLKITDDKGELLLPSWFSDNYFTLLPGEERKIDIDLSSVNNLTEEKTLVTEGWNVPLKEDRL